MVAEDVIYNVTLPKVVPLNRSFQASFRRINVILGSNGTGKSKVLEALKDNHTQFGQRSDIAFVEGGRTLTIPASLNVDRHTLEFASLDKAEKSHRSKRAQKLTTRVKDALFALERKGDQEFRRHSDAVEAWREAGKNGEVPTRTDPPLYRLCVIFSSVFPEIALEFESATKTISCKKNGVGPYPPEALSDGEKQVFCLIADILLLSAGNPLIVCDEPELNLNPSLAIDLWSLIESTLPNATFVYATHCVSFAMRRGVQSLIVLPRSGVEAVQISDLADLTPEELRPFLGAIPSVLASTKALIIEGEKKGSLDSMLYKWLVGDPSLTVEAVGSCHNVVSAAKRDGVWKTLGEPHKLVGIVDRDFRTEKYLGELQTGGVYVLPFHEIESLLCIPVVVASLAAALKLVEHLPTQADVEKVILDYWAKEYVSTAAKRTFDAVAFAYAPSLPAKTMAALGADKNAIEKAVIDCCKSDAATYFTTRQEIHFRTAFSENLALCKSALDNKSVDEILKLVPSKVLANVVLTLLGCTGLDVAARALTRHVDPVTIPALKTVRDALRARLELAV